MLDKVLTKIIGDVTLEWEQGQDADTGSPTLTTYILRPVQLKVIVTKSEYYPDYASTFLAARGAPSLRRSFIIQVLGEGGKDSLFQQCVPEDLPKEFGLIEIFWNDVDRVWKNLKTTRKECFANWLNS
jgi:hypothetical protein